MIETTSKLRAWWLRTFHGYKVSSVSRRPREARFGRIVYDSTYQLSRQQ